MWCFGGGNVVIGWFLTWWGARNGAGFVVLDAKKMLPRENAPHLGQLMLYQLSNAGLSDHPKLKQDAWRSGRVHLSSGNGSAVGSSSLASLHPLYLQKQL